MNTLDRLTGAFFGATFLALGATYAPPAHAQTPDAACGYGQSVLDRAHLMGDECAEIKFKPSARIMRYRGDINLGDAARVKNALDRLPPDTTLYLTSNGGIITEAYSIAILIRGSGKLSKVVVDGDCASACGIIFAAVPNRVVISQGRIGVHQAGHATFDPNTPDPTHSAEMSTNMALFLVASGAPVSVADKLVSTSNDSISEVTDDELRQWGVAIKRCTGSTANSWKACN